MEAATLGKMSMDQYWWCELGCHQSPQRQIQYVVLDYPASLGLTRVVPALHPLALEDVFHKDTESRSKADYYTKHLFLRVMCHELCEPGEEHVATTLRSESPAGLDSDENGFGEGKTDFDGETLQASVSKSRNSTVRRRPILPRTFADVPTRQDSSQSQLAQLMQKDRKVQ